MKTLWLLRHAKSSWKDIALPDHDRPLKKRGRKAAVEMGKILADLTPFPEAIFCSTAVRAKQTWDLVTETIAEQRELPAVEFRADLYHASPETMWDIIAHFSDDQSSVLLVGHNPGLEEFVENITGTEADFPTATLVKIEFPVQKWNACTDSGGEKLVGIWKPHERD